MTDGIYTHIDDGDSNLATAMSSFYLYYAYGLQTDDIFISPPFISFSSGKLLIVLVKPVYIDHRFIGKLHTVFIQLVYFLSSLLLFFRRRGNGITSR